MSTDLYVLGTGIRHTLQLTIETIQALESSRVTFALHDDPAVLESLREWCPDVRDVVGSYQGKVLRRDAYAEIASFVVEEALKGPTVSLVVHGHPILLVSATEMVLAQARAAGLDAKTLPGVSFLDTMLCDLENEHGYALQLFEATTMIEADLLPNPDVAAFITQIATVLNYRVTYDDPPAAVLEPLVLHLLRVYPADHPCRVISSASELLAEPVSISARLGELAERDLGLRNRPTLYLPAR